MNASKRRASFWAATVSLIIGLLAWPIAAHAGTPQYPDLRMFSPSDIALGTTTTIDGTPHNVVRFTTTLWNAGPGKFEIDSTPHASGLADLTQRIYEDPFGFRDERFGSRVFDQNSYDVIDIAKYELWARRTYDRAKAWHFRRGKPLYTNNNVAYCLADNQRVNQDPNALPNPIAVPPYECTTLVEGISPGFATVEDLFTLGQWVDIGTTPLPDGEYVVRVIADPTNIFFESDGKADPTRESQVANSGVSYIRIINGTLAGIGPG